MSYTVIITEEVSANIAVTTVNYPITIEYNATSILAPSGTYGNANVAANLAAFANNPITTTGNITAGYFVGNGSLLTGIASSTYGNANVAANLAAFGSNPITTTGNITAGFLSGNGSLLTTLTGANVVGVVAQATQANAANTATSAGSATTAGTANIALVANSVAGANVTGVVAQATQAATANVALVANSVAGANVTGVVAQATQAGTANIALVANSVAGANVTGVVAQATQAATANVANSVAGANVTGVVAQATQAATANTATTAGSATTAGTVTDAAQANITSVGTLSTLSVSGNITSSGNISGNYILGNGSQLTGLPATYGNANVAANLAAFGSNPILTTGNVTAGFFLGNGSLLTGIASSTYGNANVAANLAAFANNPISTTGNITSGNGTVTNTLNVSNITGAAGQTVTITAEGTNDIHLDADSIRIGDNNNPATLTTHGNGNLILRTHEGSAVEGNITVVNGANGNIQLNPNGTGKVTTTTLSASGNVTANFFVGNGSLLSNITGANVTGTVANATFAASAGSATTATTANTVTDAAQANITSVGTLTSLSVSGNITGGNVQSLGTVTAAGNLTSQQQTIVGTANVGTTGNIVVSGKNIATDVAYNPDAGNTATSNLTRVTIGTGLAGNLAFNAVQSRLFTSDSFNRTNNAVQASQFRAEPFVNLTANVTNGTFRQQALGTTLRVGGGAAANTLALTNGVGAIFALSSGQFNVEIGNTTVAPLGNTTVSHATINGGALGAAVGSTITNAFGFNSLLFTPAGAASAGNIVNYTGYSTSILPSVTGNLFMFYNGSNATASTRNVSVSNSARSASAYYFLMNEDDVAQVQLGSLRRYHEFESQTATSGSFAIDKNTAQVHNIVPIGNCTITGYSNMVVTASDGTTSDSQVDTLTIIIEQGATPYTITMPTGSQYKYAGGINTVGATANAVTMISVTAANVAGTTTYLTTISAEFV